MKIKNAKIGTAVEVKGVESASESIGEIVDYADDFPEFFAIQVWHPYTDQTVSYWPEELRRLDK